jgi:hypothetical protein
MVEKLQKDNIGDVMFTLFVHEAHILVVEQSKEQQIQERMGKLSKEKMLDDIFKGKTTSEHPDSKEVVCLIFETRTQSQVVYIPIKRIGELREFGEPEELKMMNVPGEGTLSGWLHSKDAPTMN